MALYKDLLGHNLEKFGAVTVFDATLYEVGSNKPLITFDTLTVSNITFSAEQKEIRGGQGASLLVTYDYAKTAEIAITDALASMYSLQYLTGGKLEGKFNAVVRRKAKLDEEDWKVPHTAVGTAQNATAMIIYTDGFQEIVDVTITGVTVTGITAAQDKTIDEVFVYYEAAFDNGASDEVTKSHMLQLTITAADFPPMVRLVGDTVFIDVKTGKRVEAQVEIPKLKLGTDFELTFEAEGDASVFDFNGTALAHNGEIMAIRTLGYFGDLTAADNQEADDDGENPE